MHCHTPVTPALRQKQRPWLGGHPRPHSETLSLNNRILYSYIPWREENALFKVESRIRKQTPNINRRAWDSITHEAQQLGACSPLAEKLSSVPTWWVTTPWISRVWRPLTPLSGLHRQLHSHAHTPHVCAHTHTLHTDMCTHVSGPLTPLLLASASSCIHMHTPHTDVHTHI